MLARMSVEFGMNVDMTCEWNADFYGFSGLRGFFIIEIIR